MHAIPIGPALEETARVARAAFPKGTLCLRIRDALDTIYEDEFFASQIGLPTEAAWRLALICILQFLEGLSDRQVAKAVRARINWKYLLNLELIDPGFDFSVLTEFRSCVLSHQAGQCLLDHLLEQLRQHGWIKKRGIQRTDSTRVLSAIRCLNRARIGRRDAALSRWKYTLPTQTPPRSRIWTHKGIWEPIMAHLTVLNRLCEVNVRLIW